MDELQTKLARHALGLPNRHRQSYRNHYVVGPGGAAHAAWMQMVEAGEAQRRKGGPLTGSFDVFVLTLRGARKALTQDERLGPADFPEGSPT